MQTTDLDEPVFVSLPFPECYTATLAEAPLVAQESRPLQDFQIATYSSSSTETYELSGRYASEICASTENRDGHHLH